jgi:hypothetical protein
VQGTPLHQCGLKYVIHILISSIENKKAKPKLRSVLWEMNKVSFAKLLPEPTSPADTVAMSIAPTGSAIGLPKAASAFRPK